MSHSTPLFRFPEPALSTIVALRPTVAVLPFANLSGDPEQDYFADGMVEDIITALSHIRWLFVIARNSSFTYKGRAVDVKTLHAKIGELTLEKDFLAGALGKAGLLPSAKR